MPFCWLVFSWPRWMMTATAAARRHKEINEAARKPQHRDGSTAEEDEVHDGTALHVRDEIVSANSRHAQRRSTRDGSRL